MSSLSAGSNAAWRPVVGYETLYVVSESGEVVSLRNQRGTGHQMTQTPDVKGYPRVGLTDATGNQKGKRVHLLVAAAFIGPKPEGLQVNHKDGVKTNNHYSNLEYVTASENSRHADRTGLRRKPRGQKHGMSKMTDNKVRELRCRYAAGEKRARIARDFGIDVSNVWLIATRRAWAHVP